MPHLPESARLWLERAEIDYIGPFVKAWAAFNAWYREAFGARRDAEGLRFVKERPNPVRASIVPLLRSAGTVGHGSIVPDDEPAQKFKLLIRDLHVRLDGFHLEMTRAEVVERISFRSVCLGHGPALPQTFEFHGLRYRVEKAQGRWKSSIRSVGATADVRAEIEQDEYDVDGLQGHQRFGCLSSRQQANLAQLYRRCNPRPLTDCFDGDGDRIVAGDIEFRCTDDQLFAGLIEIIYAMRNLLLHGELQPHEQAFAAYEPAYRILMRFLACLQR
jgi:hypothetical protein